MAPNMIQFIKNIWNAQRNAEAAELVDHLEGEVSQLGTAVCRLSEDLKHRTFERDQYSALTATLANEYLVALDGIGDIPDSIREAHMLRGVATNWKYSDDVKYGKPMWEKRKRMKEKRKVQDAQIGRMMTGESQMGNARWGE